MKAYGRESLVSARYTAEVGECMRLAMREMLVHKLWNTLNFLAAGLATLFVVREAGKDVLSGHLSSGAALSFAVYGVATGQAANDAANELQKASARAARASVALQILGDCNLGEEEAAAAEVCMAPAAVAEAATAKAAAAAAAEEAPRWAALPMGAERAHVVVSDVGFAYATSGEGERRALAGVSLEMKADRVCSLSHLSRPPRPWPRLATFPSQHLHSPLPIPTPPSEI